MSRLVPDANRRDLIREFSRTDDVSLYGAASATGVHPSAIAKIMMEMEREGIATLFYKFYHCEEWPTHIQPFKDGIPDAIYCDECDNPVQTRELLIDIACISAKPVVISFTDTPER